MFPQVRPPLKCLPRPTRRIVLLLAAATLASGCADAAHVNQATVAGKVTIDGTPAPAGTVAFHPIDRGPVAVGSIGNDGAYRLRVGKGDDGNPAANTLPAGDYIATVVVTADPDRKATRSAGGPPEAGSRLAAAMYADKQTSGLRYTINRGHNVIVLDLTGPWADGAQQLADDSTSLPKEEAAHANGASVAAEPATRKGGAR